MPSSPKQLLCTAVTRPSHSHALLYGGLETWLVRQPALVLTPVPLTGILGEGGQAPSSTTLPPTHGPEAQVAAFSFSHIFPAWDALSAVLCSSQRNSPKSIHSFFLATLKPSQATCTGQASTNLPFGNSVSNSATTSTLWNTGNIWQFKNCSSVLRREGNLARKLSQTLI